MAWQVDESEFRADLWAGLRAHGGSELREALRSLADAELARLPCLPVLWAHARSLHLSEVQLDLVWLHWFIVQCKCPFVAGPEVPASVEQTTKLRALLRLAVFPQLGATEAPDYCCPAERRAKWAAVYQGVGVERPRVLQFSRRLRWLLDDMEKPAGRDTWPYSKAIAEAAKRAKLRRADPVGHMVEETVGQFGVAEEFFAARVDDRFALLQRLLWPDTPLPGFARVEALPASPDEDTASIEFRNLGYTAKQLSGASLCTSIVAVRGALCAYHEGKVPLLPSCHWGDFPVELADGDYASAPMDNAPARLALQREACVLVVAASASVVPEVAKAFGNPSVLLLICDPLHTETKNYDVSGTNVHVIQTASPADFRAIRRVLTETYVRALFTADYARMKRAIAFSAYPDTEALAFYLAEPTGVPVFVVSMK